MDEETQKVEEAPQETQDVAQEQESAQPEIPTVEQLQAQLAEKEAKIREFGTKYETLEKILTDRQSSAEQPVQSPPPQPVRRSIDLEAKSEQIFEKLQEDPKAAAREFKEMLQEARQEDIDEFNRRLQLQQQVNVKATDLLTRKPHFAQFKDEVYAQVERNVNAGYNLDQAFKQAEKVYDQKLAGFAAPKEQPQMEHKQTQPAPAKPTQGIAQHMPPKPAEQPVEETYAQYMARRSRSLWDKRTKIRK